MKTSKAFAGKTVVVTGSTSGIGLGIARAFAAEGASVMMNGLGEPAAIEALLAGVTKDFGVRALYHPADMTRPAEIAELVLTAERELGAVDILVNKVISDIMLAPQPTKKFIRIEDVARVALNLADESAAQINGAAIPIDGGWTAR